MACSISHSFCYFRRLDSITDRSIINSRIRHTWTSSCRGCLVSGSGINSSEDEDDDISLPQRKMKREMERKGCLLFSPVIELILMFIIFNFHQTFIMNGKQEYIQYVVTRKLPSLRLFHTVSVSFSFSGAESFFNLIIFTHKQGVSHNNIKTLSKTEDINMFHSMEVWHHQWGEREIFSRHIFLEAIQWLTIYRLPRTENWVTTSKETFLLFIHPIQPFYTDVELTLCTEHFISLNFLGLFP